jgi:hypothetical protein
MVKTVNEILVLGFLGAYLVVGLVVLTVALAKGVSSS